MLFVEQPQPQTSLNCLNTSPFIILFTKCYVALSGCLADYLVSIKIIVLCVQEDTGQMMCQAQTGQALRDRGQGIAGIPARTLPRESRHSHFPYPEREGG